MNTSDIKKEIIRSINTMANPANITSQVISQIVKSDYTAETIRSLIIDPITSKCIPHIHLTGYQDVSVGLWSLLDIMPDVVVDKIFEERNIEETINKLNKYRERGFVHCILDYLQEVDNKTFVNITCYKGSILYISYKNSPCDSKSGGWLALDIYFIGLRSGNHALYFTDKMDAVHAELLGMRDNKTNRRVDVRSFENGSNRPRYSSSTVPKTIILDHVQKELDEVIAMVKKSEDIQKEYQINNTTGVLLYGTHGTGKSTISRYLAMELNRILILTTSDNLQSAIDYVKDYGRGSDKKYILLIEDIDFMFVDRRKMKKGEVNDEMMNNTSLLFQVMDGVLSDSNLLVIATTNYIDRLDPALIRDGRFDFKIEVNGLNYENAVKVCERFDVNPTEINLESWKTPISPATLQSVILKHKVGGEIQTDMLEKDSDKSDK